MSTSGIKSPKAPRNTLKECVELTQKLFKEASRASVDRPTAAKAMGYSGLSGSSLTLLASLVGYGLLSKKGSGVRVSDLAIEILHPTNDEQKKVALKKAALNPVLFAELAKNHGDCSEAVLGSQLIQSGFAPEGAKKTASVFIANKEFANLDATGYSETSENGSNKGENQNPPPLNPEGKGKPPIPPAIPPLNPAVKYLPIPLLSAEAQVPFPMSEDDYTLLLDTLKLWKKRIVATTSPTNQEVTTPKSEAK